MCVSFPAQQSTPSAEQSSASAFLSEAPFPHLFNAAAQFLSYCEGRKRWLNTAPFSSASRTSQFGPPCSRGVPLLVALLDAPVLPASNVKPSAALGLFVFTPPETLSSCMANCVLGWGSHINLSLNSSFTHLRAPIAISTWGGSDETHGKQTNLPYQDTFFPESPSFRRRWTHPSSWSSPKSWHQHLSLFLFTPHHQAIGQFDQLYLQARPNLFPPPRLPLSPDLRLMPDCHHLRCSLYLEANKHRGSTAGRRREACGNALGLWGRAFRVQILAPSLVYNYQVMDYYTNVECAVVFKLFPLRATVTATKVGFSGGFQSLLISKDLTQESN